MTTYHTELKNIFDNRILNIFLHILPYPFKLYIYEHRKDDVIRFCIYISKGYQQMNRQKNINRIGSIECVLDASDQMDFNELEFVLEDIQDREYKFNKKKLLDYFKQKKVRLGVQERKILKLFALRFIQNSMNVNFVSVQTKFRGQGVGTYLLIVASTYALKKYNMTKITLDDDSKHAWRKNNMYIKTGLSYINKKPNPEMEGYTQTIVNRWKEFKTKYGATFMK